MKSTDEIKTWLCVNAGVTDERAQNLIINSLLPEYHLNMSDIEVCKVCRFWRLPNGYKMGKCGLSQYKQSNMFGSGCGLYTREDFGCKLFEPLKKQGDERNEK